MRAVVFERCGGPEVLEVRELPEPAPRADEVLVEVRACGVNHLDLWVRRGLPGLEPEMPHVLGSDVAGVVARAGEAVRHVRPGDRVLVNPTLSCGACDVCAAGDDHLCREHDVLGRRRNGGYAAYVAVPGRNVLPCPARLSFEEAAAVPLVFMTAWHMLVGRARVRPGETVLVVGAGSGVGSAAIQIAKLHGARVIATAGGAAKLERARALGADEAVDHAAGDFAPAVRALTGRRGVDVAVEHVGGAVFEQTLAALARDGRLVTCGATAGGRASLDLNLLFGRHLAVLGSWMGRKADLVEALRFVADGRLRPVLDSVLPLAEARRAHARIEAREHFGKVVLVP
uniref:Alcohol dehydrogenase n=1 Tax=Eiseniibacteriota bacterium TaxID=2212470 RepID=A0A832I803_UNCEI